MNQSLNSLAILLVWCLTAVLAQWGGNNGGGVLGAIEGALLGGNGGGYDQNGGGYGNNGGFNNYGGGRGYGGRGYGNNGGGTGKTFPPSFSSFDIASND